MWNRIKREDFGPSCGFLSGVLLSGSVSQPVCVFVIFFYLFFKLLVFVISSSIHSFSSELLFLYSCPRFLCARRRCRGFQFGCSRSGLGHGHQISFTQFCWRLTLNCQQLLFFSSACTVSNYPHHHPHYYYHQCYRHHLQSSALFWPFNLSLSERLAIQMPVISTVLQTDSDYNWKTGMRNTFPDL